MSYLRNFGLPGLGRFRKVLLGAVGSVGGGIYLAGGGFNEREHLVGSGDPLQVRFKTGFYRVAAAGTVAWELVRGALNPFANIGSTNISQEQEVKRANCSEVTFAGKVASILACLSNDSSCREVLITIGGGFLVKWLVKHAVDGQGTLEQEKSEEAILNFLHDVPQLLVQAANSSNSTELVVALEGALQRIPAPTNISQDDIRDILTLVKGRYSAKAQHISTLYLAKVCESSVLACQDAAEAGAGEVLSIVADAITAPGTCAQFKCDVARLMLVVARDCPSKQLLMLESWVSPLLYMLADAAATKDSKLAHCAVDLMGACVDSGINSVQNILGSSNLWPLLKQFGRLHNVDFNISAAAAVAALSLDGMLFPQSEVEYWTKQMLKWLFSSDTGEELREACCTALTGLASSARDEGLDVARHWLGELIISLSESLPESTPRITSAFRQVAPSYARFVAAEVQGLTAISEGYSTPPDHVGESVLYQAAQVLDWLEEDGDRGTSTSRALKVLCDLVVTSEEAQKWLVGNGVLAIMQRLVQQGVGESKAVSVSSKTSMEEQIGRSLAMLSKARAGSDLPCDWHRFAQEAIVSGGWVPWLEARVNSDSIRLASSCTKTLLHLESCQKASTPPQDPTRCQSPVFHDGIHIFNPIDQYCWQLGHKKCRLAPSEGNLDPKEPGQPLLDVVFVHGIRGGAFATWRKESVGREVSSDKTACWPSAWLAKDVPQARLLGIEYAAPVSGWEGESAPFQETAHTLLSQLMDAGVGLRPVVFVAHSMGGILVKEMLAYSLQETSNDLAVQFVQNTKGLVFYSTPHHGTWLARLAVNLKHVGASPAQSLSFLKPGPYLMELNQVIQEWSEMEGFPILHFSESVPTQLLPVMPKIMIVPPESAFPGFGESIQLVQADHVAACKPAAPDAISYSKTMQLILDIARNVGKS